MVVLFYYIWSTLRSNHVYPNKVLAKVILKLITVNMMINFNSIKLREASITLTSFVQKRKNYSDFLCMNAMHTPHLSLFQSSNAGTLQTLPLKINFIPELRKLSCFGVRNCIILVTTVLNSMVTLMGIIVAFHIQILSLNSYHTQQSLSCCLQYSKLLLL